ncbi:MAG: diaminopimelate epimerase, partial [Candidatus Omnitrophica bacterium]|nr:diaminopimelate epimerase [Candidatus Omnitrophota bacterium]
MNKIDFAKAVASGNDFIIINRIGRVAESLESRAVSKLAKELCQRKFSVGADGLLLLDSAKQADVKMRIFNPDGTEVEMCGNGARCLALYAAQEKICDSKMIIETQAGDLQAEVRGDKVQIKMSRPKDLKLKFDLDVDGQIYSANFINTGVPHLVCFVQDLENVDVQNRGRAIRYHREFAPEGTNADFVEVLDKDHIRIRTYERGVEQETLACGTGCVAAGIITAYSLQQDPQGEFKV